MVLPMMGLAPSEPVRVGQKAPPLVATNIDGNTDMQGYYHDRFVLLTFWSLDDADSKRQFEELKKIRRTMAKHDRLLILSVCTENSEDWDRWRHFLEGQGKVDYGDHDRPGRPGPFTFYMDHKWVNAFQGDFDFVTSGAYGVKHPSDAFLIGPDRKLWLVHIRTDKLADVVTHALERNP
jgi:hypothetical protein